ncbi:MAG TPA: transposase [Thermoanaerobaculia bacterium]|jgi:REP element-mobilizing transposase RayT
MASTFTKLLYHMVFSTKNRVPSIHNEFRERLYEYMGGIVRNERGILVEIGGVADHVHLLVGLKADTAVAVFLREVKSGSSKWLNQQQVLSDHFE